MAILQTDLAAASPFDFDLTASYRTRHKGKPGAESFSGGVYRRLCNVHGKRALISVGSTGTVEEPRLWLEARGEGLTPGDLPQLSWQAEWLLGMEYDLSGFYSIAAEDPLLEGLVSRFRGLKPTRNPDLFESLITLIIEQQISGKVAGAMLRELVLAYGEPLSVDGATYRSFPTPERLVEAGVEALRRCKLSQRKAEYIHDIALAVSEGTLDLDGLRELGDEPVIEKLVQFRGIGAWTAQWVLCDALGRFNIFPASDLALLRTISRVYLDGQPVSPQEADAFSERWGAYRVPVITYLYAAISRGMDLRAQASSAPGLGPDH